MGTLEFRYEDIDRKAGPAFDKTADTGLSGGTRIRNRNTAVDYVRSLPTGPSGSMLALFLDRDFNLLSLDQLGEGNLADCGPKPLHLVSRGEKLGAIGFILIHHAPRRISKPSPEEYRITKEIRTAGEDFDVHLLDHLIVTQGRVMQVAS